MRMSSYLRVLQAMTLAALLLGSTSLSLAPVFGRTLAQPASEPDPSAAEAAIRAVILRSNAQQEEAIAAGDSSVMRDTATARYYTQMERINDAMLDGGVTRVELVNLEWGPVVIEGASAEATTYETWAITTRRGQMIEPSERNIYRLIHDDGVWKIDANEHPDEPLPLPGRQSQT